MDPCFRRNDNRGFGGWIPDQVGNDNGGWGMDDGAGGLLTLPYRPFDSKGEETNPGILGCHDLIWGKG
jgi:hypothetical protein